MDTGTPIPLVPNGQDYKYTVTIVTYVLLKDDFSYSGYSFSPFRLTTSQDRFEFSDNRYRR